ncbi:hypothetical protein ACE6H2_007374 [Prunus campanulata]
MLFSFLNSMCYTRMGLLVSVYYASLENGEVGFALQRVAIAFDEVLPNVTS